MINYNLNIIKLCSACVKKTAAVMIVNSLLKVDALSDVILQVRVHVILILNKFIMKSFLV